MVLGAELPLHQAATHDLLLRSTIRSGAKRTTSRCLLHAQISPRDAHRVDLGTKGRRAIKSTLTQAQVASGCYHCMVGIRSPAREAMMKGLTDHAKKVRHIRRWSRLLTAPRSHVGGMVI